MIKGYLFNIVPFAGLKIANNLILVDILVNYWNGSFLKFSCSDPLSREAEKRVDQRSVVGVSPLIDLGLNVRGVDSPGLSFARPLSL